jgi:hypothetical protein
MATLTVQPDTGRNTRRWVYVAALVALLALVGLGLYVSQRHRHQQPPVEPGATLFGTSLRSPADVAKWRTGTAKAPRVVRVFFPGAFPATWGDNRLLRAVPASTTVVLSFKAGSAAALTAFLRSRPKGQPVYASYWHEPENEIEAGMFTAAQYRRAWQAYGPAIRAAGGKPVLILTLTTALGEAPSQPTPSTGSRPVNTWSKPARNAPAVASRRNWRDYYPGDAVDMIAWDGYNPARKKKPPGYTNYETQVIPRFTAIAAQSGKPWGMGEFGSPVVGTDARRVAWVTSVRRSLVKHGAVWACWWDDATPRFDDTATPAVIAAWLAP